MNRASDRLARVATLLGDRRYRFAHERELQDALERVLADAGIAAVREAPLGADRVEHGAGPAAHPAPPSVADHDDESARVRLTWARSHLAGAPLRALVAVAEALVASVGDGVLLARGVVALATLTGRQLFAAVQYLERAAATPSLDLRAHRAPECSRCHQRGHNVRTCTGQLLVPGSEP